MRGHNLMSVRKSKNILGLFSILIMMHHLGQKTSASWVPAIVRQRGLEFFVPIGYLLVSFFFFCSGYGLIKSMRSKEEYFKGFLVKRLNRVLMAFIIILMPQKEHRNLVLAVKPILRIMYLFQKHILIM